MDSVSYNERLSGEALTLACVDIVAKKDVHAFADYGAAPVDICSDGGGPGMHRVWLIPIPPPTR